MQTKKSAAAVVLPVLATLFAAGCQGGDTGVKAASAATVRASTGEVSLARTDGLQLVVGPDGNEVRYRIREQLVGLDLPNDAVGATKEISGGIAFDVFPLGIHRRKIDPQVIGGRVDAGDNTREDEGLVCVVHRERMMCLHRGAGACQQRERGGQCQAEFAG